MTYPLSPNSCLWNSANHHCHNYCKTQNYVRVILQLNTHTSDNILSKTFIFKPLKFGTKWLKIYCPFSLMFSHDKIYLQSPLATQSHLSRWNKGVLNIPRTWTVWVFQVWGPGGGRVESMKWWNNEMALWLALRLA